MGWTSYRATYYKNGKVDRKAECDAYFMESLNRGHFKVLKSSMVGSVYYAAIENQVKYVGTDENGKSIYEPLEESEKKVWAAVFLTSVKDGDFYYKDMDEDMIPFAYDCPKGILDLLSPTEKEGALEWRRLCEEKRNKKKNNIIKDLPYGSKVEWTRWDGEKFILIKQPPAYQFKTWWWQIEGKRQYTKKTLVNENNIRVIA